MKPNLGMKTTKSIQKKYVEYQNLKVSGYRNKHMACFDISIN